MPLHIIELPSGGKLDLDCLPDCASVEMLQACRDRIFLLEGLAPKRDAEPCTTPYKARRRSEATYTPAGRRCMPETSGKARAPAFIAREKRSIVKDVKKRIGSLRFHVGIDKVQREVKFLVERLSPEAAEQVLGISRDAWASPTVTAMLRGKDIAKALSLESDELRGAVWLKGGCRYGRFGSPKARRIGTAPLQAQSLSLSYTVKSQRLTGTLACVNSSAMAAAGKKRPRGDECGGLEDLPDTDNSGDSESENSSEDSSSRLG